MDSFFQKLSWTKYQMFPVDTEGQPTGRVVTRKHVLYFASSRMKLSFADCEPSVGGVHHLDVLDYVLTGE
jgi:hypothetical protein